MPIRPDFQTRYDAAMQEHHAALAAGKDPQHIAAAVGAAQRAAEIFARSRDPQELELRHTALLYAAGAFRTAGRLPEAEARAVDDKTARLKSLRLAKEAAKKVPEANAPPPRRKKR